MKTQIRFLFLWLFLVSCTSLQAQTFHKKERHARSPIKTSCLQERSTSPACFCLPVRITTQPVSPLSGCIYNSVHQFTVAVCGSGPFKYQWKENSINISDGGVYSGAQTNTLVITDPGYDLNGKHYRCVITNCNGHSVISDNNALLSVTALDGDINKDGAVNSSDLLIMNQHFNTACNPCQEDINGDGFIDNLDFLKLLGEFYQTCN